MRHLYHATAFSNLGSILSKGIKNGFDGVIYLAETREDALKFVAIRLIGQPIAVIEVEIDNDNEKDILESFDHSQAFFKCRAWMSTEEISPDRISNCWKYE